MPPGPVPSPERGRFFSVFPLPGPFPFTASGGACPDAAQQKQALPALFLHQIFSTANITIKRIYDPKETGDGYRVLVDRLWPRGISKEKASWDEWLKNVAPSTALRQWFAHDPAKWDAFRRKYDEELDGNKEAVSHLLQLARKGKLTLLYSARNTEHNEAAALRDYLMQRSSS